jgi:hypothetical protein
MRYVCEQLGIPREAEEALVALYTSLRHDPGDPTRSYCQCIHHLGADVRLDASTTI